KLVRDGRGGYCYEQNTLLQGALRALGFEVRGLAARVLWGHSTAIRAARTHMLLLVKSDGRCRVVDVGFGALTLTGTLAFRDGLAQATPHGDFRLEHEGGAWVMKSFDRGL